MQKVYCLSGLGADKQIFQNIHINGAELIHVPWPDFDEHDEIPCYAQKISGKIKEENPILMGVSFGGMLAVEIAKLRPVKKVVIISSSKTGSEIPHFGRFMKTLVMSEILPGFFYKWPNKYLLKLFGANTEDEKQMIRNVLKVSDGLFMRWAMKAIQLWRNTDYLQPIVHIHGDADKIITPQYIHADYWIKGGSHIMIYNRAKEINEIINKELQLA
ncbi:MAG: alpha/beta hydrolase [Bacteroidetes bacterium]|nr:alpha/beta hydrolase [Bacteroidota bacterium]